MARANSRIELLLVNLTGLQNFSLLTVLVAFFLCLAPHVYAVSLTRGNFKADAPRSYVASMQKKQNKTETDLRFLRAEAAHLNGFETLALYAVAISIGNVAGLPTSQLNSLSLFYILSRIIFILSYIFLSTPTLWWIRSLSYFGGIAVIFRLFWSAAAALQ
ncbi:hypothetical protein BCV69DRAFT_283884 [Microstroma glucosiphilum]|uniref:MAPEG family protein n=1 Tax=Pseudomicrostroma glucosiphilum TaxID=1684307 RepID=A0A316U5P4_9BASI|nr:hypothetical protein BCV69DRAFT_283884 [Pseudomicrostroma glucosiphilum]PWN19781.1 hypothetical protein BCV69DRAFT_283884 [Pseudomicrostroma glucosiphilum]